MQTQDKPQTQITLFGILDEAIGQVFQPKELKNSKGANVGTSLVMASRKEIAERLNLKGKDNKDNLDEAILAQSDAAFRKVKSEIAGLNGEWTLGKCAVRTLGNGVRQITVVAKEIKRQKGPKDEDIAKALGWTVEQVVEARARQKAALATPTLEA